MVDAAHLLSELWRCQVRDVPSAIQALSERLGHDAAPNRAVQEFARRAVLQRLNDYVAREIAGPLASQMEARATPAVDQYPEADTQECGHAVIALLGRAEEGLRRISLASGAVPGAAGACRAALAASMTNQWSKGLSARMRTAFLGCLEGSIRSLSAGRSGGMVEEEEEEEEEGEGSHSFPRALAAEWLEQAAQGSASSHGPPSVARLASLLSALGLWALARRDLLAAVQLHTRRWAELLFSDDLEEEMVPVARRWTEAVLVPLVAEGCRAAGGDDAESALRRTRAAMTEAVGRVRLQTAFETVRDYPESRPALQDLRVCVRAARDEEALVKRLRSEARRRLLQAGATTQQVLEVLLKMVQALTELDPSGVILEAVAGPVHAYLRGRSNTIRCVIEGLTDRTGENELARELAGADRTARQGRAAPLVQMPVKEAGRGDDALVATDFGDTDEQRAKWSPEPTDADPSLPFRARHTTDLLARVIGIFRSQELFVEEYRRMLAERLLCGLAGYDTREAQRTHELLRMRFGDEPLHACGIMLRDMQDSRRTRQRILDDAGTERDRHELEQDQERSGGAQPLSLQALEPLLVSKHYWPALGESELTLPPAVDAALRLYATCYGRLREPRTLHWLPAQGSVEVEVQVGGEGDEETRSVTCSPAQAAVLLHVASSPAQSVPLEELVTACGMPDAGVRRAVAYWVGERVLAARTEAGALVVTAFAEGAVTDQGGLDGGGDGREGAGEDEGKAAAREAAKVYTQFVVGMLTNFNQALELERIHSMLAMFAATAEGGYTQSLGELRAMLHAMAEDNVVEEVGPDLFRLRS